MEMKEALKILFNVLSEGLKQMVVTLKLKED